MTDVQNAVTACSTLLREDIDERECEVLASMFELRKLVVDEVLLSEGAEDNAIDIVIEGDVEATRNAGRQTYRA